MSDYAEMKEKVKEWFKDSALPVCGICEARITPQALDDGTIELRGYYYREDGIRLPSRKFVHTECRLDESQENTSLRDLR